MNWLNNLNKLFRRNSLADAVRASAVSLERNLRSELVAVPEWGQSVYLRGLTLSEWSEYNRMAQALSPVPPEEGEELPAADPLDEPWKPYGHRALFAYLLVATLRDAKRAPVFAPAGSAQRAQDIAEVAQNFTHVHDALVARIFALSGVKVGTEEQPSDPVADAGNA